MEQPACGAQAPTSPGPSLLSLPDIAHASIASFLPDGDTRQASLRLSEVSGAYLELFGDRLTQIRISFVHDSSAARLVALLRRQTMLIEIIVDNQESIASFCEAIAQGCCRRVERIVLQCRRYYSKDLTREQENLIARALELEGALPALKTLEVHHGLSAGGLIVLSRALQGGTAPVLQHLVIRGCLKWNDDEAWDACASMVEARASLPGCARFESFDVIDWLRHAAPREKQIRLLRALLPSAKELPVVYWQHVFEACFVEVKAPFLTGRITLGGI